MWANHEARPLPLVHEDIRRMHLLLGGLQEELVSSRREVLLTKDDLDEAVTLLLCKRYSELNKPGALAEISYLVDVLTNTLNARVLVKQKGSP